MPSKQRLLQGKIEEYLALLKKERRAARTIQDYRRELNRMFDELESEGMEISPMSISSDEIDFLRENVLTHSEGYNRWRLSILGSFLDWCGNKVVSKMRIGWPQDMRVHANWLEDDEAMAVKNIAEGIEKVVVHLELDIMLRRIEVLRLKPTDFQGDRINVLGKGRMGGKWRTIPMHGETREVIGSYMLERKRIIAKARAKNPTAPIPDALLIYERNGRLGAYQKTAVDKILIGLKKRVETHYGRSFDFSNHTLRRTGGRMMWKAGVKIETISSILGHEDIRTTIDYLGLNLTDMMEGMQVYVQYQRTVKCPQNGIFLGKPVTCSGPKEI